MRTRRTKEQIRKDNYNKEVDAYNFYVVNLETMRAETGFEFKEDAVDLLNDYDDKKKYKVVSKRALKSMGVENPNERFKYVSGGSLIGNQKRIDLNKNGKIDAEDFKLLRSSMNGAYRNERKHVNRNEDYEVRYARNKPSRTGYKGKRNFASGGEIESAIKGYREYTKKNWEGYDYFSEKYAVNELAELELDLRKLNDGKLAPSKVIGGGYKNARKLAQEWLESQIKKQKSIIKTNGLSNKTNHSNFRHDLVQAKKENVISEIKFNELLDESNEIMDSLGETYAFGGMFGGRTYSTGRAYRNERNHVNHNEDYEVRYARNKPSRTGYKGKRDFASGGGMEKYYLVEVPAYNSYGKEVGKWYRIYDDKKNLQTLFLKKRLNSEQVYSITEVSEKSIAEKILNEMNSKKHNPNKVLKGEKEYASGGSLENHGLKKGDRIIKTIDGGIQEVKDKDGNIVYVNLANGERSADIPLPFDNGGEVKYFVNKDGIRVRSKVEPKKRLSEKEWMAKHSESKEARAYAGGGKLTFKEKARAIAKNFVGKSVKPKYQKEYGKTYDAKEAKEVGNKIAGAQKAKYDAKAESGTVVKKKSGNPKMKEAMVLAKKIRKDGEKWTDAVKRAYAQIK